MTIGAPLAGNLGRAFGDDDQRAGLVGAPLEGSAASGSMRVVRRENPVGRAQWTGPGRGGSPPGVGVPTSSQGGRET